MSKLKHSAIFVFGLVALGFAVSANAEELLRPAVLENKIGLEDIQGLDVDMYTHPLTSGQTPGAEIGYSLIRSLTNHPKLPFQTPNDAFLTLSCGSSDCTKIVAQVGLRSQGGLPNGPVLWRHEESVFKHKWLPYANRESDEIANAILKALLMDYTEAKSTNFQSVGLTGHAMKGRQEQQSVKERIEPQ